MSKRTQFSGTKANAVPTDRLIDELVACFSLSNAENVFEQFSPEVREQAADLTGGHSPITIYR